MSTSSTDHKLYISAGNTKLGSIPNLSLPPITTCLPNVPCADKCYAKFAYLRFAKTRAAWDANLTFWREDPVGFALALNTYLDKRKPVYFRWHVGGDIPDPKYAVMMDAVAFAHPRTQFLCYTRTLTKSYQPNLTIVVSHWLEEHQLDSERPNGWVITQKGAHYLMLKTDKLYTIHSCQGSCKVCHYCWYMKPGDLVVFKLHGGGYKHE